MSAQPLCGACRTRPRKQKPIACDPPQYYDWCAVCRSLAGLDQLEKQLADFHRRRGDPPGRQE